MHHNTKRQPMHSLRAIGHAKVMPLTYQQLAYWTPKASFQRQPATTSAPAGVDHDAGQEAGQRSAGGEGQQRQVEHARHRPAEPGQDDAEDDRDIDEEREGQDAEHRPIEAAQ